MTEASKRDPFFSEILPEFCAVQTKFLGHLEVSWLQKPLNLGKFSSYVPSGDWVTLWFKGDVLFDGCKLFSAEIVTTQREQRQTTTTQTSKPAVRWEPAQRY